MKSLYQHTDQLVLGNIEQRLQQWNLQLTQHYTQRTKFCHNIQHFVCYNICGVSAESVIKWWRLLHNYVTQLCHYAIFLQHINF